MSTPLVLVPGMLCGPSLWTHVRDRLHAPAIDVTIDAPDIERMAEDVLASAPERFVLGGLSLGAIVGFEVLRRAPDRVAGFCAISTNASAPRPEQYASWRSMAERTEAGGFDAVVRDELVPAMFAAPEPGPELVRTFTAMAHDVGPESFLRQLAAQATRTDAHAALGGVRCPTSVVCGSEDALCPPRINRAVADSVPGSTFRILAGAGHLCTLEQGRQVADLLNDLTSVVDRIEGAPPPRTSRRTRVHQQRKPMTTSLKSPAHSVGAAATDSSAAADAAARVIDDVRARGDAAVRDHSGHFDDWTPESFRLSDDRIEEIVDAVPAQAIEDIKAVQHNVREFAELQRASLRDLETQTRPGVFLGQRHIPVRGVGAYVPGGRYPLTASAHMTVVTAKAAGVPRVVVCTPPIRGEIPAATVAAAHLAGADEIYILGGVQAIAAMALGTDSMARVDMVAGPGNAYVAEAKRQLFGEVGIDLFAGPTETLVVADATADPFVVAVDLLSQAEHGPDSPAVLVSSDEGVARATMEHIERLLPNMPTRDFAEPAWRDHGQVLVVHDVDEAYRVADTFASEHVQILTEEPRRALESMSDYGALFLGEGTCVSYGDKVIGTNHVLPTRGAARYTGGLWVGKYLKTVTYQEVRDPAASAELGRLCGRAARVELFEGHARSGDVRAGKYEGDPLPWAREQGEVYARGAGART